MELQKFVAMQTYVTLNCSTLCYDTFKQLGVNLP